MYNYYSLAVSDCDLCHCRGQGGMLHMNDTPVLFTCAKCEPAAFWAACAHEWKHIAMFLDVYQNEVDMSADLYMARMEEVLS